MTTIDVQAALARLKELEELAEELNHLDRQKWFQLIYELRKLLHGSQSSTPSISSETI